MHTCQVRRCTHPFEKTKGQVVDPTRIDVTTSIDSFGLDSLMLTQFQVSIVRALDLNVPLIKLLKGPSIANLSLEVLDQLASSSSDETAAEMDDAPGPDTFTLADLEGVQVLNPWLIRGSGAARRVDPKDHRRHI